MTRPPVAHLTAAPARIGGQPPRVAAAVAADAHADAVELREIELQPARTDRREAAAVRVRASCEVQARAALLEAAAAAPAHHAVVDDEPPEVGRRVGEVGEHTDAAVRSGSGAVVGGGGGRGMRVVHAEAALLGAISLTKTEAQNAFNNDVVYMEKFLETPRHIEFQVLGDGEGHAIHLG